MKKRITDVLAGLKYRHRSQNINIKTLTGMLKKIVLVTVLYIAADI